MQAFSPQNWRRTQPLANGTEKWNLVRNDSQAIVRICPKQKRRKGTKERKEGEGSEVLPIKTKGTSQGAAQSWGSAATSEQAEPPLSHCNLVLTPRAPGTWFIRAGLFGWGLLNINNNLNVFQRALLVNFWPSFQTTFGLLFNCRSYLLNQWICGSLPMC